MSKIYDALEHAQKERISGDKTDDLSSHPSVSLPVTHSDGGEIDMEEEMISLYQTIASSLPDIDHRSVLIVGSRSNEGTSTIARHLAKTVSLRLEKTVLLIDLDRSRPDLHVYANLSVEGNTDEVVKPGVSIERSLRRVEESSLYVMPLFQNTMITPRTLESAKGGGFWEPLKERFDLIIVDSPPATLFPDGPGIVSQVDGVLLVVEAERTRWQVALSVKEKILKSGGTILGVVLNKRKYYIPQWLYKRI